jgi:hypothetical protein
MTLTPNDCVELYYAVRDEGLQARFGIDGEALASGKVTLTDEEAETCYFAVMDKREAVLEGFYDDKPGEVQRRNSTTNAWARHLGRILAKLTPLVAGDKNHHVNTSFHRSGCVTCQMAYDKRLLPNPS